MHELEKTMYFNAKPETIEAARILREKMTYAEKILWEYLNKKQIYNLRFRRQHPIDFFIADFYCHKVRLVIEIDGEVHKDKIDYDEGRTAEMERYGIKVIRFRNEEIESNIEEVILRITDIVKDRIKNSL